MNTFVSSLFPSPLAPKSRTLKVVELFCGGLGAGASFGGGGNDGAFCGGGFGFDAPLWCFWWLLPWFFPFFLAREAEFPLLSLQCLPLLAMQVWKLEDQTRKAMKSMNVRHLKLNPLMFTIMRLGERERERAVCISEQGSSWDCQVTIDGSRVYIGGAGLSSWNLYKDYSESFDNS